MRCLLSALSALVALALTAMPQMPAGAVAAEEDIVVADSAAYAGCDTAVAPEAIAANELIASATAGIIGSYPAEWAQLSMQGKLKVDGLPVNPNIKIYMDRGKSILLSARAPILGEVARIEICKDSITFINKHTRRYFSADLSRVFSANPSLIADIQDILLGQVAYPGHGRLTEDLAALTEWSLTPEGLLMLFPSGQLQHSEAEYGFLVDPDSFRLSVFALMLPQSETIVDLHYLYGPAGYTLQLTSDNKKQRLGGELQLSSPDFNPTPLTPTDTRRYVKSDIKGILKF